MQRQISVKSNEEISSQMMQTESRKRLETKAS